MSGHGEENGEGGGDRSGVRVASLDELDEPKLVEVEGKKVLLYHGGDGVRAYRNVCPHQYGPVAEGQVEDGTVFCPWHGWGFDLETGTEIHGGFDRQLSQIRTTVDDGDVYIRI